MMPAQHRQARALFAAAWPDAPPAGLTLIQAAAARETGYGAPARFVKAGLAPFATSHNMGALREGETLRRFASAQEGAAAMVRAYLEAPHVGPVIRQESGAGQAAYDLAVAMSKDFGLDMLDRKETSGEAYARELAALCQEINAIATDPPVTSSNEVAKPEPMVRNPPGMTVASVGRLAQMDPDFLAGFHALLQRLGWTEAHGDALAALMHHESGFKPDATNPVSRATGLIQFMPKTALGLGTTVDSLRVLSATEQLPYVERYFIPFRGIAPRDIPIAGFGGKWIGQPDETPTYRAGETAYEQNRALDRDGDGVITLGEVRADVLGPLVKASQRARLQLPPPKWPGLDVPLWALGLVAALAIGGAAVYYYIEHQKPKARSGRYKRNASRAEWRALYADECGAERKARRLAAREEADKPCEDAKDRLRDETRAARAKRKPRTEKQRLAARSVSEHRQELVEMEAIDVEHSIDPPWSSYAARIFRKEAAKWLRLAKATGGRTRPAELFVNDWNEDEANRRADAEELIQADQEAMEAAEDEDDWRYEEERRRAAG